MSYSFLTENDWKYGDVLSLLLFNFSVKYSIENIQETNLKLVMNDIHQVLACIDYVNLIGGIRITEKNTPVLIIACKDIGLAVKNRRN